MSYTLKFEHPQFPADTEIGIPNLGLVVNGSSIDIDEDAERLFVAERGLSLEDAFKDNGLVTLSGSSSISADELQTLLPAPEETNDVVTDTDSDSGVNSTGGNVLDQIEDQHDESGDN